MDYINKITDELQLAGDELYALFSGDTAIGSGSDDRDEFDGGGGDSGSHTHNFDLSDMDLDNMSEEEIQELLAEELMQNNPLQGIAEDVTQNIMAGQARPDSFTEHFQAFRSAITWSEKFIMGLIAFHVVMFFLCFFVSRRDRGLAPRLTLMVTIFVIVRSAEWLNAMGAEHWESFATQNYFDRRGIFVAIMLSGPLLLDVLMMLLLFIREAALLLVKVKRTEIQRKKESQNGKRGKKAKERKQD